MSNSTSKRSNVLFLLTDDQRHDTIHALGNDIIKTPNLDRYVGSLECACLRLPGERRLR